MSLPHLLKYIYNNGTEEVIRRGKRIFSTGGVEIMEMDGLLKTASFRVKSDTHSNTYKVIISKYHDPGGVSVRCQCPYNLGDICRHEAAALFQLQEMIEKNHFEVKELKYDQKHTVVKMKFIDLKSIKLLTSPEIFHDAERILSHHVAKIQWAKDEKVEASLFLDKNTFSLILKRNEERNFDTHCNCEETEYPLCRHKTVLFLQLLKTHGPYYFDSLRNWDKEKNKLLSSYGYSLEDEIAEKFTFTYLNGKPFLRVLDPNIKKVESPVLVQEEMKTMPASVQKKRLGVVFNANEKIFPFYRAELVSGEANEACNDFINPVSKLDLSKYIDYFAFAEKDRELIPAIRKIHETELNKYLNKNSPFAGIWENIHHDDGLDFPSETKELILEYLHPKLIKLLPHLAETELIFLLPPHQSFVTRNLRPLKIADQTLPPYFKVQVQDETILITCWVDLDDKSLNVAENEWKSPLLFLHAEKLWLFAGVEDAMHIETFMQEGSLRIAADQWPDYLETYLLPLTKKYRVDFDPSLLLEVSNVSPEPRVYLKEVGESFIIRPAFLYNGQETEWDNLEQITLSKDGQVLILHRNKEAEESFIQKLRNLHENFLHPTYNNYFFLRARDTLKNNWFFLFFDALKEMGVGVFGFEGLKNFKFNSHKPETNLHISSGIDWFDAQIEVLYGDQSVSIRDIKKALADRQNFVQLSDGTLGLLPEDWIKKYSLLFKIGEEKGKGLKLSKYNFGVIDELYEFIDDEAVVAELEVKRKKLLQSDQMQAVPIPDNIRAHLRPYQESGFQWLNYLDEIRWGGILADDMGLGKTVQALTLLQHYKNKHGSCLTLVVCPTTLIYNWENEVHKFTPNLSLHIHHSATRARNPEELKKTDIVITTYGTLRSDIQMLMLLDFDYVILDESQAIKNPHSKVTKATQLLRTKNRLALSGTPMQNNTFDIYAQMNFLNPGMLGSIDFFRNEFANPIDKFQDEERKEHLRKLIYPFILRRTKEQVAKDLPEKTEMVLYCEMEAEQRNIYDAYRNAYRSKILGVIEEQGMERSQLTILQGLMKLRQICDSPAILNEEDHYPNVSVKLDELTREISENVGHHKVLIFSQFLGMLALIREKLQEQQISFEYFDGSTSAPDREKAITNFQNNDDCRVFLISLKAGGVGLNLTAADYVYIVDPWWNPAVEQQAIDRTHRIGQTKNIFAYRMICKETVEEKILQLQDKKRSLVKDIISDDAGFIKKLTREDVLYLFS
ncbi:MAG: DEAD/DEAH box helicase [Chitinophagaceae bacterium]